MSVWYHPKYNYLGVLGTPITRGPMYYYNRYLRMYVGPAEKVVNNAKYQQAFPIYKSSPKQAGWIRIGEL